MSHRRAFTLIEMAIVLVIMGLIIGLTLPVVEEFIQRDKVKAGQNSVENLREIIIGYAIANGHLPDPDNIASLGLPLEDPWGQEIEYIVPDELDDEQEICHEDVTTTGLDYVETAADGSNIATIDNVAFVLVSRGPNQNLQTSLTGASPSPYTQVEYFPRGQTNSALKVDDIAEYATLDYLKGRVCAAGTSTGPIGSDVSFAKNNMDDFAPATATASNTTPTVGYVTTNTEDGTLTLGDGSSSGTGCFWYSGNEDAGDCASGVCDFYPDTFSSTVSGGVRVYFVYEASGTEGSGWTFAIASAAPSGGTASTDMCGGTMLGYSAWDGITPANPVLDPKFAIEFDYYQSSGSYSGTDPDVLTGTFDPHVALVFWGLDYGLGTTQINREDDNRHNTATSNAANPANPAVPSANPNTSYANGLPYYYGTTDDYANDGKSHAFRLDVAVSQNAGGDVTYDYAGCIDCDDSNDLTQDYNNFGNWTSGHSFHYSHTILAANVGNASLFHALMKQVYFGWTNGNGSATDRKITISDFGLAFR